MVLVRGKEMDVILYLLLKPLPPPKYAAVGRRICVIWFAAKKNNACLASEAGLKSGHKPSHIHRHVPSLSQSLRPVSPDWFYKKKSLQEKLLLLLLS